MSNDEKIKGMCVAYTCNGEYSTGFLVKLENKDKDIIITTAHGLETYTAIEDINIVDSKKKINIIDVWISNNPKKFDVAILIVHKVKMSQNLLDSSIDDVHEEMFIWGYPYEKKDKSIKVARKKVEYSIGDNESYTFEVEKVSDTLYKDAKSLMEGMSGSPIYFIKEDKVNIVGMFNATITSDMAYSEINVIPIEHIIHTLDKEGIISVRYSGEGIADIRLETEYIEGNEVSILLLGKSGGGKSSFIKTFAKHSDLIDASGEGQTTRTSVEYNFFRTLRGRKPNVQIKFLTREEFVLKRLNYVQNIIENQLLPMIREENAKTERKLFEVILNVKSFFSYKEFSDAVQKKLVEEFERWFSRGQIKEKYSVEEYSIYQRNEKEDSEKLRSHNRKGESNQVITLIDVIELFYAKVYSICSEDVKNYPQEIELDKSIDTMIQGKLRRCLKVCKEEGKVSSITGMIDKVIINDKVSDTYISILEDLDISKLTLIDTYGLDHDQIISTELLKYRLRKIFNEHKTINTIFYIRKLDSSSPSDLETVIPTLYDVEPKAVLYMIFTEIDKNEIVKKAYDNSGEIDLLEIIQQQEIKAVQYFVEEEDGPYAEEHPMKEMMLKHRIPQPLIESTYKVLIKNLVPYCGKIDEEDYKEYIPNNMRYISRIFKAIINQEHLGNEIISIDSLKKHINSNQFEYRAKLLLANMFELAAIKDWYAGGSSGHGHWKTQEANVDRIQRGNLGYWGTYCDLWNMRFLNAYNDKFTKLSEEDFRELFNMDYSMKQASAILKIFTGFSNQFLGCEKYNYQTFCAESYYCTNCKEKDKCFKTTLLDSYAQNELSETCISRAKWLNERCNFDQRYNRISEQIYSLLKEKLINDFLIKCREHNIRSILAEIEGREDITLVQLKERIFEYISNNDSMDEDDVLRRFSLGINWSTN